MIDSVPGADAPWLFTFAALPLCLPLDKIWVPGAYAAWLFTVATLWLVDAALTIEIGLGRTRRRACF